MLTDLWIENFKGIGRRQHIPLRPITLLFGANNAGKSTVLNSLLYLREIIAHQDCNPIAAKGDCHVDLGGFAHMTHIDNRGLGTGMIRIGCRVRMQPHETAEKLALLNNNTHSDVSLNDILDMLHTATVHLTITQGQRQHDVPTVSATEIWINDQMLCTLRFNGSKAAIQFEYSHPLLWTLPLACFTRRFEEYLLRNDLYCRLEAHTAIQDQLPRLCNMSAEFEGFLPIHDTEARLPTEGFLAVVPMDFIQRLLCGSGDDDDYDITLTESAVFVMDTANGQWTPLGVIVNFDTDEEGVNHIKNILQDSQTVLNARRTFTVNNCWHSMPTTHGAISLNATDPDIPFQVDRIYCLDREKAAAGELRDRLLNFLLRIPMATIQQQLGRMIHIGPKRRDVPRTLSSQTAVDFTSWRDGSLAWRTLLRCDDDWFKQVSEWLSSQLFLGTGATISRDYSALIEENVLNKLIDRVAASECLGDAVIEIKDIVSQLPTSRRLRLVSGSRSLQFQDVGEGLTQVVPILVALAGRKSFVTVEQPELHLHPAMQARLGDVLLQVLNHAEDCGVLIETHSEHLILRILRRIRQTTNGELPEHIPPVRPENVCVLWVDNLGDGTTFQRLRIDDQGEFMDRWPRGFFSERAEELF